MHTKNGLDRLVVLNDVAKQVVEEVRGEHPVYVFICIRSGRRVVSSEDDSIGEKAKYRPLYQLYSPAQKSRKGFVIFIS